MSRAVGRDRARRPIVRPVSQAGANAVFLGLCCLLVTTACSEEGRPVVLDRNGPVLDVSEPPPDSAHERALVFVSDTGAVISPWLFGAVTSGVEVVRSVRAWRLAEGQPLQLLDSVWTMPLTRAPGRVLPGGGLRMTAALGGSVERVMADPPSGSVQLQLGEPITGRRVGMEIGAISLARGRLQGEWGTVAGTVLDIIRAVPATRPLHGNWGFLVASDSLAWVIESDTSLSDADTIALPGRLWTSEQGERRDWVALDIRSPGATALSPRGSSGPEWSLSASEADFRAELVGETVVADPVGSVSDTTQASHRSVLSFGLVTVSGNVFLRNGVLAVSGIMTTGR